MVCLLLKAFTPDLRFGVYRDPSPAISSLPLAHPLVRIDISPADISSLALQKVDVPRLLSLLFESDQVNGTPNPFSSVTIETSWGLSIFSFHTTGGQTVIMPCFNNILQLVRELVVNDAGKRVDRYAKVVEELLKVASDELKGRGMFETAAPS